MNQMIKNNAGYDLKQLFIGTEGTLGIVTRAVLRCRELVHSKPTALVGVPGFSELARFLKVADRGLGGCLSAFEVMWQNYFRLVTQPPAQGTAPMSSDYPFYVLVEALGADDETLQAMLAEAMEQGLVSDAVMAQSEAQRLQLWGLRDDVEQTFQHGPVFVFDVSLRIPYMEGYVNEVNQRLERHYGQVINYTLGHMGDGNLHFVVHVGSGDVADRRKVESCVYEPLRDIGGSVSAEHGVGLEKKPYLGISRSDPEVTLMRHLKRSLDPKNLLNPGKIFSVGV